MRIIVTGIMLTLLFVIMLMLAINIKPVRADGTIYINADGSITPPTAPISTVDNVVYTFTGNINSAIVVERDSIVIDGNGYRVQGAGNGTGIDLSGRTGVTIHNAQIKAFDYGILLSSSSKNNVISGNNVTNNGNGIWLNYSSDNTISGNHVTSSSGFGLSLYGYPGNTLVANIMAGNEYNLWVPWEGGLSLPDYLNNMDASNTVDGKPVYYWIQIQDMTIPSDAGCVILVDCTRITVKGLTLRNNGIGVRLSYTTDSIVTANNLASSYRGIVIDSSSNNNITGNNITNSVLGIRLFSSSSSNNIWGNNLANNNYGVDIAASGNMIYHNNFIHNSQQVSSDGSPNTWDDGYPSGGNFWSNYTGVDLKSGPNQDQAESDGIGETPYVTDASNIDRYPLTNPYSPNLLSVTKTVAGQGFTVNMSFTLANYGDYPRKLNVTIYANTTVIGTQTTNGISNGTSTPIKFTWNTTEFAFGNYTLWASAANDNCTGGSIFITIPCDLNGDFKVGLQDLVTLAQAYSSHCADYHYQGEPASLNWNPNADTNNDGKVDLSDLVILAQHYGQHYP